MAKRMAAQQRGLLYGLVASIFVIIGLAVLLVLQMGEKNATLLAFNSRTDDPEAVKRDMDNTMRALKSAGVEAPNIMAGTQQLIKDLDAVQVQMRNLAMDISGASDNEGLHGTALAKWGEQVHIKARDALTNKAADLFKIIPMAQVPGIPKDDDGNIPSSAAHFAEVMKIAEIHMNALATHYKTLVNELETTRGETAAAREALAAAQRKHEEAIAEIRSQTAERVAALEKQVKESQDLAADFERQQQETRTKLDETLAEARREKARLEAQMLDLDSQIRKIMASRPRQETALFQVDGHVISIEPGSETAFINLGKGDGVHENLTFTVFDPQELGKDEPQPKGYVRIVRVLSDSSEVRVVNHKRASPIVRDDVLVNIAYDPQRKFQFAIVGKLDITGDGRDDRAMISDMIRSFGGVVVDEASVETDYIVVGGDPLSGVQSGEMRTPQEQARFLASQKEHEAMAKAVDLAQRVMIPVLNQNRFLSLVGMQPGSN